jgi:hypothetical protein
VTVYATHIFQRAFRKIAPTIPDRRYCPYGLATRTAITGSVAENAIAFGDNLFVSTGPIADLNPFAVVQTQVNLAWRMTPRRRHLENFSR